MDSDAPDVFDHVDFRSYLTAWFEARKRANPRFSHRLFARRLGSSDPSALRSILTGRRRASAERVEDFVRVLGLEGARADYFRLLVAFGQAETTEARHRAFAAIAELRSRLREPEIDSTRFLYLSDRLYPAVQSLAQCAGFEGDPAWVAAQLDPPIDPARARDALELLERLGFLVRKDGALLAAEPMVRTSERVSSMGSYGYHRQSLAHALGVLERLWTAGERDGLAEETAFLGTTLAVPESRLPELRRLLWEAITSVLHQSEAWTEDKERVVQVAVQMYPVSRPTREKPS